MVREEGIEKCAGAYFIFRLKLDALKPCLCCSSFKCNYKGAISNPENLFFILSGYMLISFWSYACLECSPCTRYSTISQRINTSTKYNDIRTMCTIKIYVVMPPPPLDLHLANKTRRVGGGTNLHKNRPAKKKGAAKSRGEQKCAKKWAKRGAGIKKREATCHTLWGKQVV